MAIPEAASRRSHERAFAGLYRVHQRAPSVAADLELTRWARVVDPHGRRETMSWDALIAWIRAPRVCEASTPLRDNGKPEDLAGWSPATFRGDRRKLEAVERVTALVLDLEAANDGPAQPRAGATLWPWPCAGVAHDTFSSTTERARQRVILRLARPVTVAEHARLWTWAERCAAAAGLRVDPGAQDASRLSYVPARLLERPYVVHEQDGPPLDPDLVAPQVAEEDERFSPGDEPSHAPPSLLSCTLGDREHRGRALAAAAEPSISGRGGDAALWRVALSLVRGLDLPPDVALEILRREFNPRCRWPDGRLCPWSEAELRHKVQDAAKARARVGYLLDPGERAAGSFLRTVKATQLWRGHSGGTDLVVARAVAELVRRHGTQVILAQRTVAVLARVAHRTAGRSLNRLVERGLLVLEIAAAGRRAAVYRLGPLVEREGGATTSPEESQGGSRAQERASASELCGSLVAPPPELESEAWRRAFGGRSGLGPGAARAFVALWLGARSRAALVHAGVGCRAVVPRWVRSLREAGLVVDWEPVTSDPEEMRRILADVEHRLGLAGATAAQRAEHERQRAAESELLEDLAGSVRAALQDRGGRVDTVAELADDLGGMRVRSVRRALELLRDEAGAVVGSGSGPWTLVLRASTAVERRSPVGRSRPQDQCSAGAERFEGVPPPKDVDAPPWRRVAA